MEAVLRRSIPQLNALRSFEAAARHQSFTRAADELCVTQGAVSHQVKALEAEFGLKLFNRERQGLVITEAGHDYLAVVRDAFDRIALGTDRLLQRLHSGVITVSTSPDFAAKWLISRLGRFAETYPQIELKVSATMHHVDFAREDVDLAIRDGAAVGRAVSGLQPGSPSQSVRYPRSGGRAAVSTIAFERPQRLVEVAGSGRRVGRRTLAWPDPQPRQLADRCRHRWSGDRACPYRSRCGRSDQWSLGAAVPDRPAPEKYLLDRVPPGDFGAAKDCRVPCLAPGGGSGGHTAVRLGS